jgi:hypothetical protein
LGRRGGRSKRARNEKNAYGPTGRPGSGHHESNDHLPIDKYVGSNSGRGNSVPVNSR